MKRFQTMGQSAGRLRPFYKGARKRIAALCAVLVVSMGSLSISANAEENDVPDTSDSGTYDSSERGIAVSETESLIITQEDTDTEGDSSESDGLYANKYLTDNGDGTITVTLESYVTGESTKTATSDPVDILLVLDASTSMTYSIYDSTAGGDGETCLEALQAGAAGFIATIQEQNTGLSEEDQSRIAIMGFNWSLVSEDGETDFWDDSVDRFLAVDFEENASNAELLMTYINNWSDYLDGGTPTGDALEVAQELLAEQASGYAEGESRRQVIIFFTDGWPTMHRNTGNIFIHGYSVSEAAQALTAAYQIKQSGIEIYCVNVLTGIEVEEGEDLPTYEKQGFEGTYSEASPIHYLSDEMNDLLGEVYAKDGTDYQKYINTENENVLNLQTRFMYLLSSDNPDADDIDDDGVTTGGYFYTAHDMESLTAVFETLAAMVGSSSVELGTSAESRDYITADFVLSGEVQIYTADYNGDGNGSVQNGTWADPVEITDPETAGYAVTVTSQSVVVSGFDYAANYVSDTPHTDGDRTYYGCKLIITFSIAASGSTFGGNQLPTNTTDSGIYTGSDTEEAAVLYPVPYADVEIVYEIEGEDAAYYVPDTAWLSGVLGYTDGYLPDGENNAYVDITYLLLDESGAVAGTLFIPAGSAADSVSWVWEAAYTEGTVSECGTYQIVCMVSPVNEGTYGAVSAEAEGNIHIYYPELTLQDTVLPYGSVIDVVTGDLSDMNGLDDHYVHLQWTCEDGCIRSADEGPAIGYRVAVSEGVESNDDGELVIATQEDVPIVLGVYRVSDDALADDVTAYTVFHHECGRDVCGYSDEVMSSLGIRCLIHVTDEDSEETLPDEETGADDEIPEDTEADDGNSDAVEDSGDTGTVTYSTEATDYTAAADAAEEEIVITTEATPLTVEAENEETGDTPTREVPQTGDETEIIFWLLCTAAAAIVLAVCVERIWSRRRR